VIFTQTRYQILYLRISSATIRGSGTNQPQSASSTNLPNKAPLKTFHRLAQRQAGITNMEFLGGVDCNNNVIPYHRCFSTPVLPRIAKYHMKPFSSEITSKSEIAVC